MPLNKETKPNQFIMRVYNTYTLTYEHWPTSKDLQTSAFYRHWIQSRTPFKSNGWKGQMMKKSEETQCYKHDLTIMMIWKATM